MIVLSRIQRAILFIYLLPAIRSSTFVVLSFVVRGSPSFGLETELRIQDRAYTVAAHIDLAFSRAANGFGFGTSETEC